jgi:hypothetical protein
MGSLLRRRIALAIAAAAAACAVPAGAASFPTHLQFRTIPARQATVHYHQGMEAMARRAAALSDAILDAHEARYGWDVPRVTVVLADVDDDPNGFATPLPYPMVHVRAAGPDGSDEFGNHDGWLRLVLAHELAHVVHLEVGRGLIRLGRRVFGRAPFLFPNAASPTWMVEGLATYEETELTAFGRGRNPDTRMVLRMDALAGWPTGDDEAASRGLDRWPSGAAPYLFGEAFLRDVSTHNGADALPRAVHAHAGRVFPYLDERTGVKVTGTSWHRRWSDWQGRARQEFLEEKEQLEARGTTEVRALTTAGLRQVGPRWSPDGAWIAYTSRRLTAFREIRVMRPDGTGDRRVAHRNGGQGLSWTPDGRSLVFDEGEIHERFTTRYDLRRVDVATGRVRRLTRGLRARDPDVAPDGSRIVFVRVHADGTELALIGISGGEPRTLAPYEPGTYFSDPRWNPTGEAVVAARLRGDGELDLVRVDARTGAVEALTADRAKDVEPVFTPDGRHVVFRSDRDGVSNLYALRLSDRALLRVTRVVGGAFTPAVAPDGARLALATYSHRGYDLGVMDFDAAALAAAEPFVDRGPASPPQPPPSDGADAPYRAWRALRPRFWMPYVETGDEVKAGVATGGADPLLRHAYALAAEYGEETGRAGFQAFYQYDRWLPTLFVGLADTSDPSDGGGIARERRLDVRVSVPLVRRIRSSHSASLAWRRSRETVDGARPVGLDLGGLEAAWTYSSVRQFPWTPSPVEGHRFRVAWLAEVPALGSDRELGKLTGEARAYRRGLRSSHALALRAGAGATFGQRAFTASYAVGGFPDGTLFDVSRTNHAVLRGYRQNAFTGRSFTHASLEYRAPLFHPQRGYASLPVFLRHVHASVFADAAHAWTGAFRFEDVKTSAGAALGTDITLAHGLPLTMTGGVAHGFAERGGTRGYFRFGLSF